MLRLLLVYSITCSPVVAVIVAENVGERTIRDAPNSEQMIWQNIRRLGVAEGFT